MQEIDLTYDNLLSLKAIDRSLLTSHGQEKARDAFVESESLVHIVDELRDQMSREGNTISVSNKIADLKRTILHSKYSNMNKTDYFETSFEHKTPIISLRTEFTDAVIQTIKSELKSIEVPSRPLAFDMISLNGNLQNAVQEFNPEEMLPLEKLMNTIVEFKSINFEWLKEKIDAVTSIEDARGVFSYCLLDTSTIFANLSNLRKPHDLTKEGLQEMAEWLRQNIYVYEKSEGQPEFIEYLLYYLERLQNSTEYFEEAASLNNLPNISEKVRGEFR